MGATISIPRQWSRERAPKLALTLSSSLRHGRQNVPPRIVVHGIHGIGKSTFAASAPKPVFIPTESGVRALDVTAFFGDRFPSHATSERDVLDAIGALINENHDFGTVVIDTADWLELLIHSGIAADNGAETIHGTGRKNDPLGYSKGYGIALTKWQYILEGLDVLCSQKGMVIILLAHSQITRFDDPMTSSYDRYLLDMHKASSALLAEWCDILGFFSTQTIIVKEDVGFNKTINKGTGGGTRVLYLEERPGFIAKNRYGLPSYIVIPQQNGWQSLGDCLVANAKMANAAQ
jgi:hypothetical protein